MHSSAAAVLHWSSDPRKAEMLLVNFYPALHNCNGSLKEAWGLGGLGSLCLLQESSGVNALKGKGVPGYIWEGRIPLLGTARFLFLSSASHIDCLGGAAALCAHPFADGVVRPASPLPACPKQGYHLEAVTSARACCALPSSAAAAELTF
jgi:hypothetical protein